MNQKKISVFFMRAVLMIAVFAIGFVGFNFIGCGGDDTETGEGITDEEQRNLARFVEYIFFPTSPYVDKSWIEKVPEEEVAKSEIDFPTETAAIQKVYTDVYNAWNAEDFEAIAAQFYPSTIRFVFLCTGPELPDRIFTRRLLSKNSLKKPWNVCNGGWLPLSSTPLLTEFYIRGKNVQAPWPEASAKTADDTYVYLTKQGDTWYMNELVTTRYKGYSYADKSDTRKYFDNSKYKAP